ncbi:restriction endonuclease subunit S [Pseudomonas sp. MDMC216]|nr:MULTISPECIES: restriction endonuclease subunit S [unclassified Pseudomonas]MDI5994199.1 restriction endonuclease subunit S [Pseudomonas sp. MDMC216]MDI6008534.1 restriction endonuclease subunit S [Pseudomonas sp. MDMC17]RAR32860.1 type I restriction endonuclease subunit S [Pseudomonas sp. MDMC224]
MSELPKGWAECSLEDLLGPLSDGKILHQGWSPQCESTPAPKGEWGVLKTTAVQDGYFLEDENKALPSALSPKPELEVKSGDLLMTCAGPRSRCGVICHVPKTREKLIFSGKIYRFRPNAEHVEPKFLTHLLRTAELKEKIDEIKTGISESGMNMTRERFFALPVRLAPLAEQTRIAQKLDELLAQVDTLKARIDAIPALLKRFRQSVLAAAISGRLTEEWRSANSDSKSQYNSNMPVGWSQIPLGRYAINFDGARRPISAKERESLKGEYPYFGATGQIDSIDGYTHEGEFVLVGEDGANLLTRTKPIAFIVQGKIWVNNHAHVIASPTGHSNSYLAFYLNTLDITPWVSGSAQPKLNQKNMNEIPVFVPPPEEQTEIVRHIEQLFAFADQLEAKVASAKSRIDHLTQSILAKTFRGELVPQDPNDEPASVLLERIQAQRAAAPKAKRGRKASV